MAALVIFVGTGNSCREVGGKNGNRRKNANLATRQFANAPVTARTKGGDGMPYIGNRFGVGKLCID